MSKRKCRKPIKDSRSEIRLQSSSCSAGTYIRTLAEDIGKKLGTGAHLAELRRTRAGKFDLSKAVTLEKLEEIVAENRLDESFDFDERSRFAFAAK